MGISTYEGRVILFNNGVVDVKQGDVSLVDSEKVAHIPVSNVAIDNETIIMNANQQLEVPIDEDTIYIDGAGFMKAKQGGSGATYSAGEHITIDSENVISAQGPEVSDSKIILCTKVGEGAAGPVGSFTLNQNSGKTITIPIPEPEVKEYTAGTHISIDSENVISAEGPTVPTKVSELENDSHFITSEDIPEIPTKLSELDNDTNFITSEDVPEVPEIDNKTIILNSEGKMSTAIGGYKTIGQFPDLTVSGTTNDWGYISYDFSRDDIYDFSAFDIPNGIISINNVPQTITSYTSGLDEDGHVPYIYYYIGEDETPGTYRVKVMVNYEDFDEPINGYIELTVYEDLGDGGEWRSVDNTPLSVTLPGKERVMFTTIEPTAIPVDNKTLQIKDNKVAIKGFTHEEDGFMVNTQFTHKAQAGEGGTDYFLTSEAGEHIKYDYDNQIYRPIYFGSQYYGHGDGVGENYVYDGYVFVMNHHEDNSGDEIKIYSYGQREIRPSGEVVGWYNSLQEVGSIGGLTVSYDEAWVNVEDQNVIDWFNYLYFSEGTKPIVDIAGNDTPLVSASNQVNVGTQDTEATEAADVRMNAIIIPKDETLGMNGNSLSVPIFGAQAPDEWDDGTYVLKCVVSDETRTFTGVREN